MKNILLVSNTVPHYRVSVYNYLAKRFREKGLNFVVASDGMQTDNRLRPGFDFHGMPFGFLAYRRLILELKPEVVLFHLHLKDPLFWQLMHWLKLRGTPVVCYTKGANLDVPRSWLRHALFNHFHWLSDAIILYSMKQLEVVRPAYHGKVLAANNTVNFEDYPAVDQGKEEIKAELGIPFRKMVLFAGTMNVDGDRKKVGHLVEIFSKLEREDVGLVIVGGGLSEALKARLNPRNTRYLGKLHDETNLLISKVFKAADVFAIPGHVGLAVNQAFYWGVPVVTEDGMHPPEIQYLKPGRNGFMVPENDLAAFRDRILELIDNDALRAEFSRNAREDILKDASIEHMFDTFHEAIQRVSRHS